MSNVVPVLEDFFTSRFVDDYLRPVAREMRFSSVNMHYCIFYADNADFLLLADPVNPNPGFPALEIGFKCQFCVIEQLSGGIPALFCYSSPERSREELKLVVTKVLGENRYSVSPVFKPDQF